MTVPPAPPLVHLTSKSDLEGNYRNKRVTCRCPSRTEKEWKKLTPEQQQAVKDGEDVFWFMANTLGTMPLGGPANKVIRMGGGWLWSKAGQGLRWFGGKFRRVPKPPIPTPPATPTPPLTQPPIIGGSGVPSNPPVVLDSGGKPASSYRARGEPPITGGSGVGLKPQAPNGCRYHRSYR